MEEKIREFLLASGPSAVTDVVKAMAEKEGKPIRSKSLRAAVDSALAEMVESGSVEVDTSSTRKRFCLSALETAKMAPSRQVSPLVGVVSREGQETAPMGLSQGFRIRLDGGEVIRKRV